MACQERTIFIPHAGTVDRFVLEHIAGMGYPGTVMIQDQQNSPVILNIPNVLLNSLPELGRKDWVLGAHFHPSPHRSK